MKSVTETLKTLIATHGKEIVNQPQRLKAMLADLLPHEKRMRYLVDLSLQADIPKKIMAIHNENFSLWDTKINSLKHYFKEEYFLEDKPIKLLFDCWVEVILFVDALFLSHNCHEFKEEYVDEYGVKYNAAKTKLIKLSDNLIEYSVLNSVEEIGSYAFAECHNLKSVILPNSLKSIGDRSFRNCINLLAITIPYNVEIINRFAFENCSNLENVIIENSKTEYDFLSFYKCDKLFKIQCLDCVKSKNQGIEVFVKKPRSLIVTKSVVFNPQDLHDIPFSEFRIIRVFCRLYDDAGRYRRKEVSYKNIHNGPIRVYFVLDINDTHYKDKDEHLYIEASLLFNSDTFYYYILKTEPRFHLIDGACIKIFDGKLDFCIS